MVLANSVAEEKNVDSSLVELFESMWLTIFIFITKLYFKF
jgi:hypothetical protein